MTNSIEAMSRRPGVKEIYGADFPVILAPMAGVTDLPLCIDSSFPEVIEAALRRYPGRALINSISYEKEKLDKLKIQTSV